MSIIGGNGDCDMVDTHVGWTIIAIGKPRVQLASIANDCCVLLHDGRNIVLSIADVVLVSPIYGETIACRVMVRCGDVCHSGPVGRVSITQPHAERQLHREHVQLSQLDWFVCSHPLHKPIFDRAGRVWLIIYTQLFESSVSIYPFTIIQT